MAKESRQVVVEVFVDLFDVIIEAAV